MMVHPLGRHFVRSLSVLQSCQLFSTRATRCQRRHLTTGSVTRARVMFNRHVKRLQRDRASSHPDATVFDYLKDEVGWRVADRLADVRRRFDTVLDLGCGRGHVVKHLDRELVGSVTVCDMSGGHVRTAGSQCPEGVELKERHEDEQTLRLPADSLSLAVSCLSLHWLNDPESALNNVLHALKPDAPLVGACLGGHTLHELRTSLQLACLERCGGVRRHMSPLLEPIDITTLLTRAGFSLITVDVDSMVVRFPSVLHLLWDLQGMAESGAPIEPDCVHLGRDVLVAAEAVYREMFGEEHEKEETCVPATFQVIHFIGWKPSPDQPQPASRGSAQVSFKDLAKVVTQGPETQSTSGDAKSDRTTTSPRT